MWQTSTKESGVKYMGQFNNQFNNNPCCPPVQQAPVAVAPCVGGLGGTTGMILVLFILLVIILRAFPIFC